VARGEFREDLYYRLRQVVLEVPSLRQRLSDLPLIASSLLTRIGEERGEAPKRLSDRALAALSRHAWPGNVRELENALRAAALFAEGDVIEPEDFTTNVDLPRGADSFVEAGPSASSPPPVPPSDRESADGATPAWVTYTHVRSGVSLSDMKRQIERECIARALEESGGNITRAAVLLGMKRPRLSQLVKQYGLGSTSEDG
jgi:DNA-binding NtrC family response regulator